MKFVETPGELKETVELKEKLQGQLDDAFQKQMLDSLLTYKDVLCVNNNMLKVYALHLLNHVFKRRDLVIKNNHALNQGTVEEARDQGFTRPQVLVLLPFRHHAYLLINYLLTFFDDAENKDRFEEEFGGESEPSKKPTDYQEIFAGNVDDNFKIGCKFTRQKLKLFSDFYSSDILICSPLGLKPIIGEKGDKKRDFDFLSSIDILIIDKAHLLPMQNFNHVTSIWELLNVIPVESHGCDFSRVKHYFLDNQARQYLQTLIFTDYLTPELKSLKGQNIRGSVKVTCALPGVINPLMSIPQTFKKIPDCKLVELPDVRFQKFCQQLKELQPGTIIYIPSYFDFIRVKNHCKSLDLNYGYISEYSSRSKADSTRHHFKNGTISHLVISERYYFYRRPAIKCQQLFFYSSPTYAPIYKELVMVCAKESLLFYSPFDQLALERIVGSHRIQRFLKGNFFILSAE